jgi:hypothetical protein
MLILYRFNDIIDRYSIVPADCDVNWSVHVLLYLNLCTEFSITMTQNLWEKEKQNFSFQTETQKQTHIKMFHQPKQAREVNIIYKYLYIKYMKLN